jgi:hypothetical protein
MLCFKHGVIISDADPDPTSEKNWIRILLDNM